MNNWLTLNKEDQINFFNQVSFETGLPPFAIEKDAWVTLVLRMLFSSELNPHIVFKGGTSLSKCYNLIDRFSEDIDFSLDKAYLGFEEDLSKGEIRKLRRASHKFTIEILPLLLAEQFDKYGIDKKHFSLEVPNTKVSDQDPETLFVNYNSLFDTEAYLTSRVQIEIGARFLIEPFETKEVNSIIDMVYPDNNFTETKFNVRAASPVKTLIEKLILLHEEFKKPEEKIKHHRMTRHLYDISKLIETKYFEDAKKDSTLFKQICLHRKQYSPVKPIGIVDYSNLVFEKLEIIPPPQIMRKYRDDYNEMRQNMIYGESRSFDEIIKQIAAALKEPRN